jgi:hypothetical protein
VGPKPAIPAADPLHIFDPLLIAAPASCPGPQGAGHPLRWDAQVTAGKDLYVSESTDLAMTGAQDATGTSEAPAVPETAGRARRRGTGLSGMLLPELQRLATELGISGTGRMRKGDLVAAISERQVGGESSTPAPRTETPRTETPRTETPRTETPDDGADRARGRGRHGRAPRGAHQRRRQRRPSDDR